MDALRVFGIENDSIVDGPGLRLAVFAQGCPHRCEGCHNPQSHDPDGGTLMPLEDIAAKARKNPLLAGVTLTGGEPLEQATACLKLLGLLPQGLSVWLYSGWTWEQIHESGDPDRISLTEACDVLVDGRFEIGQRSLSLMYRGSGNQRLIDVRGTLAARRVVLWQPRPWRQ